MNIDCENLSFFFYFKISYLKYLSIQVTDHLFVFEGEGVVKDYIGSLSDYAECLVEQEDSNDGDSNSATVGGDTPTAEPGHFL